MPSGPAHLHAHFGDDSTAIEFLESHGYKMDNGFVFHPPNREHRMTDDENDAVDYLIQEWDYGYHPDPIA